VHTNIWVGFKLGKQTNIFVVENSDRKDDDNSDDDDDENDDGNGGVRFHRQPLVAAVGISNCLRLQNHPSIIFMN